MWNRIERGLLYLRKRTLIKVLDITLGRYIRKEIDTYGREKFKKIASGQAKKHIMVYIRAQNFIETHFKDAIPFLERQELHDFALSLVSEGFTWWAEFGVYVGTTLKYFASRAPKNVMIYGFDSFEGLPEDWEDWHPKGYFKTKVPELNVPNVPLVKGWFDESLPRFLSERKLGQIGFIHMDADLYSSTKIVLDYLAPYISSGTVIVFDEFYHYPGFENHEYKAFSEWVKENNVNYRYVAYCTTRYQVCVQIL